MKLQHPSGFFSVYITTSSLCAPLDSLLLAPLPLNTLHPFVMRFLAVLPPLLSFFLPLYPCRQEPSCTKWCDGCNWLTPPLPPIRLQLALGALWPLPTTPLPLTRPTVQGTTPNERRTTNEVGEVRGEFCSFASTLPPLAYLGSAQSLITDIKKKKKRKSPARSWAAPFWIRVDVMVHSATPPVVHSLHRLSPRKKKDKICQLAARLSADCTGSNGPSLPSKGVCTQCDPLLA